MLTCKQVSESLENVDYAKLSPWARFMLRLHISLCVVCGKYNKQRMVMHDTVRGYLDHEDEASEDAPQKLDEAARERLRACVHDARQ